MTVEALMLAAMFGVVGVTQLTRLARGVEQIGSELARLRKIAEDRNR